MSNPVFFEVGQFTGPTADHECSEVMWSNGTACRRCPVKSCYRNGWLKKQVDADNYKLYHKKGEWDEKDISN